ncbi:terminase small subunit [Leuconostoc citreum]|uniref:terminase small subunit n=1 Tax=Leuconostoc citreum TaxID=33964 RepID=UPI0021A89559|nr:terminase small subunit [Leuconostoc citreum]MCT3069064.1 terminase small subunit [Leuconostoc citreum]
MKLTPKQQKFADEYIKSGNATESARLSGYKQPHVQGSQNLEKLSVKTYIDERMAEIKSKRVMGYTEAVELLTSIARGEEKETVVVSTPIGVEEVEKEPDTKTRIIAVREILKRYPNNDKLVEQQIRKLSAEADIAEANAREVTDNGAANGVRVIGFDRRAEEDERS